MVSDTQLIEKHYTEMERGLTVRESDDYARLVVPNGNSLEPVHRWFHMKEAYSAQILPRVLKDLRLDSQPGLRILDPFSGVATTVVSALLSSISGGLHKPTAYGIESNPFLALVGSTKVGALTNPPRDFLRFARVAAARALHDRSEYPLPGLSTFTSPRFFEQQRLQWLLRIRASLETLEVAGASVLLVGLGQLALGASVEKVANLRRDGRALRHVEKDDSEHPIDIFLQLCETIDDDLGQSATGATAAIYRGNGTSMSVIDGRFGAFDIVLCSPPYPNNIDYTEVYKLENWLLGFFKTQEDFSNQRMATVHSHPSLKRETRLAKAGLSAGVASTLETAVRPLIENLPVDRYQRARREVVEGYVLDMFHTMSAAAARLRTGGHLVLVVGNSAHGKGVDQHVIAADLLIASCANAAGLEVDRIEVARRLIRRSCSSPFLRESVIFARKS